MSASAVEPKTHDGELMEMCGAFVEALMMVHNIPVDFAGLSLNVLRDPDTHQLMAIVVTPVDGDEAKPRYNVDVGKVRAAHVPKIELAS